MSEYQATTEVFGPDFVQQAFVYNAYRCYAAGYDRVTGRFFSIDYSTPEQVARRAALPKAAEA